MSFFIARFSHELNRKRLSQPDPEPISLTAAWPDQSAGVARGRRPSCQKADTDGTSASAAGSTGRCNTFRELVCWGLIEQGLSGPFIELPCYSAEFGLAMQRQIGATRKILAQQSVGVFV
jgi:hypothetical protein